MSVAPMHFIFAQKYLLNRDNRSQNTSVNLDKVGFFISVKVKLCDIFVLLKVVKY